MVPDDYLLALNKGKDSQGGRGEQCVARGERRPSISLALF